MQCIGFLSKRSLVGLSCAAFIPFEVLAGANVNTPFDSVQIGGFLSSAELVTHNYVFLSLSNMPLGRQVFLELVDKTGAVASDAGGGALGANAHGAALVAPLMGVAATRLSS